jgi:hypothetical protein
MSSPIAPGSAPTPLAFGTPVPSILWDTFEEALKSNMRLLAKDIAATLGQPEAPLLNAIRAGSVRPYLFEESAAHDDVNMRCEHLCQRPEAPFVLQACNQPIVWSSAAAKQRCPEHLYCQETPRTVGLPVVYPIDMTGLDDEDKASPLYRTEEGLVLDGTGTPRGRYCLETKRLTLFRVSG